MHEQRLKSSEACFFMAVPSLLLGLLLGFIMMWLSLIGQPIVHLNAFRAILMLLGVPAALLMLNGFVWTVGGSICRIRETKGDRHGLSELMNVYLTGAVVGFVGGLLCLFTGQWIAVSAARGYLFATGLPNYAWSVLGVGMLVVGFLFSRKHGKLVRS